MNSVIELFDRFSVGAKETVIPSIKTVIAAEQIKTREQIREDWLRLRLGKFTASACHRLMGYQKKSDLPKGAKSYCMEKALELMTEFQPDNYISKEMAWGIEHEVEAIHAFMERTGLRVECYGDNQSFLQMGNDIGGSPDGLIPSIKSGLEIKCASSSRHLDYLEITDSYSLKEIAQDYYFQCQLLIEINNSDSWYFASYDPRFLNENLRLHIARIGRVECDIKALRVRLDMAIQCRNEILYRYK